MMATAGRRDRGFAGRRQATVRTPLRSAFTSLLSGAGPAVTVSESVFYGAKLSVITAVGLLGVALFAYTINGVPGLGGTTAASFNVTELPGVQLQFSAGTYAVNTLNGVV